MKSIKIVHILDLDKDNYYFNNLCDYTEKSDVVFSFITFAPKSEFAESLENRGRAVHCLDSQSRKSYLRATRQIRRILEAENPDIVHTHLFDPSLIGLTVAKRQHRKTVMTRHHSDVLYRNPSAIKRTFFLTLENYIMRKADHIIAPSQMVREVMVDRQGVSTAKISVIPYGQSLERFSQIPEQEIEKVRTELGADKQLSIVYPSRLDHLKGHKYLFEALASLAKTGLKFKLFLVGAGPYENELNALVAEHDLEEKVSFLGWRDDVLAIVSCADLVVQPSLSEALSSVTIEAVMLEKPIIATNVSGVRDTLDDGKYGKIVTAGDSEELRSALIEVIENIDDAKQRAVEGRKYVMNYMSAQRTADEHVELYRKLISSGV
jgi:glycosyltransferase involved in cell wall biosynthesis